ncbi:hypothetical protein IWW34DRAFT_758246 [Fusarium oxysporum f. sp. albedinis]|nr:hypothetical protein IWW34DRAFT_758246 [Fusarium oxysporum f. sp. albedinis]
MEPLPPLSEFLAITFERPSPLNPGIGPQLASSVTRRTCRMDFSGPRNSPIPVEHAQAIDSRDLFIRGENMRSPDPEQCCIPRTTMTCSPHQYDDQATSRKDKTSCSLSGPVPPQHVERRKPTIQWSKGCRLRPPCSGRPRSWPKRVCRYSKCGKPETIEGRSNSGDGKPYNWRGFVNMEAPKEK